MATLPGAYTIIEFTLPSGIARAVLRRPTEQEENVYVAERLRVPADADTAAAVMHIRSARARFFDLLLERYEDLDDEHGVPVTKERTAEVPAGWKAEAIARRFDAVGVDVKN